MGKSGEEKEEEGREEVEEEELAGGWLSFFDASFVRHLQNSKDRRKIWVLSASFN